MLSMHDNGYAWRNCMCRALTSPEYEQNDGSVRELFAEASAWARDKKLDFDDTVDHAATYLESRDRADTEPVIPEHVRAFCAHKTQLHIVPRSEPPRKQDPAPASTARPNAIRKERPHHRPPAAMRR